MANTSKFAFQVPNPAALDPSVLEQVYAGGAARKMGPAFNLVAANLAGSDRRDAGNAYLANISDLNRRAQEAGRMQLESERLQEFIKQGVELAKTDPTFAATPLGQFALTMGQGGAQDTMSYLANMGVMNNAAKRTEQIGSGASRLMSEGFRPPSGLTVDQIPLAPLKQGAPTSVMSAGVGAKQPKMVTVMGADGKLETRYEMPITPDQVPPQARPGANPIEGQGVNANQARAQQVFGPQEGRKFVDELNKADVSIPPGAKFLSKTFSNGTQTVQNAPTIVLPNGQEWASINGKTVRVK